MKQTFLTKNGFIRTIGSLLAVFMVLTMAFGSNVFANNRNGNGAKKKYIVVTKNAEKFSSLKNELNGDIIAEGETANTENNFLTAELTENEAVTLAQENDVIVEEDYEIKANKTKEEIERMKNFNEKIKLYKQRDKEEVKARKNMKTEWNIQAINAEDVDVEVNSQKLKVVVLDSGVDIVEGIKLADSINLVDEEEYISPMFQDMSGHGTNIASIIAGNNDNFIQGINPNIDLYSVKVLDKNNLSPVSRIVKGIYWCIENDINIINMSFGTSNYSQAFQKAIEDAYAANILMVGAAGNNDSAVEYPAAFNEVIAVAATNTASQISEFSNEGEELDIAAPGENVRVTGFFGLNGVTHGTSIATPHVTGVASLLWEKDLSKSNEFIRQLISYSAKNISNTNDCGLLDAQYAFNIYDDFAENFNGTQIINSVPVNTGNTENFAYIDDDENYVEGRWTCVQYGTQNHTGLANAGASYAGLSDTATKIIKRGAVANDDSHYGVNNGTSADIPGWYPEFHGVWRFKHSAPLTKINYIGCYEIITKIADKAGDVSNFPSNTYNQSGVGSEVFGWIKSQFGTNKIFGRTWEHVFNTYEQIPGLTYTGQTNWRKYFIYGVALHCATDSIAHSSFKNNGDAPNGERDDPGVIPNRYTVATRLAKDVAFIASVSAIGDFTEYLALWTPWDGGWSMANIKQNAIDNAAAFGYTLTNGEKDKFTQFNIDKP